jgi:hypothetical protein
VDLITPAVVATVVPLVLTLLARGSLAAVAPGELRYSRPLRWFTLLIGLVPSLAFLGIILFLVKDPLPPD